MEDFKWAFNAFMISILAFISTIIVSFIWAVLFKGLFPYILPITYFLILMYVIFISKNRIVIFGLLLNLLYFAVLILWMKYIVVHQ
jgi:hypothetical protein